MCFYYSIKCFILEWIPIMNEFWIKPVAVVPTEHRDTRCCRSLKINSARAGREPWRAMGSFSDNCKLLKRGMSRQQNRKESDLFLMKGWTRSESNLKTTAREQPRQASRWSGREERVEAMQLLLILEIYETENATQPIFTSKQVKHDQIAKMNLVKAGGAGSESKNKFCQNGRSTSR